MSEGQLAALLIWLVLLAFSLRRSLWQTLYDNPLYQHLLLGSAIALVPLWYLR
ncbi:MAG: energy-coupling factor ABC transporter permease, partial [Aeromonas veronii]